MTRRALQALVGLLGFAGAAWLAAAVFGDGCQDCARWAGR